MTRARKELVDIDTTPYYHCVCRCVRRAFLCGKDHLTGKNYEHRKQWIVDRLNELSKVYAVEVCAYAVMSNHYHVVLRLDQQKAESWSLEQVVTQWKKLYQIPLIVQRYQIGDASSAQTNKAVEIIEEWRSRLMDLSWYMRNLNEYLARRANQEDRCTGRFWEGRYKSQALLDEGAILTCMSYVDLNPIRASIAKTPEESDFTSIQQRIQQRIQKRRRQEQKNNTTAKLEINNANSISIVNQVPLMPLVKQYKEVKQVKDSHKNAMGYTLSDYLSLVDWAGRAIRKDKSGWIQNNIPPILARLNLNPDAFIDYVAGANRKTKNYLQRQDHPKVLGAASRIKEIARQLEQKFIRGIGDAQRLYQPEVCQ